MDSEKLGLLCALSVSLPIVAARCQSVLSLTSSWFHQLSSRGGHATLLFPSPFQLIHSPLQLATGALLLSPLLPSLVLYKFLRRGLPLSYFKEPGRLCSVLILQGILVHIYI